MTESARFGLNTGMRRLADSNCWTVLPAPEWSEMACLQPLRGKGPNAFVLSAGPLPSRCWLWQGSLNSRGYPIRGSKDGGLYLVHRRVVEERDGEPLPTGMQSHHRCEIKTCVNPAHLERLTSLQHGRLHACGPGRSLGELALKVVAEGGHHHYATLAERVGAAPSSMAVALKRAADRGELRKVGRGTYAALERRAVA